MRFEVEFKIHDLAGRWTTYVDRIADVKDGFWSNKEGQFTKASDNYAFILPHMITYILKIEDK